MVENAIQGLTMKLLSGLLLVITLLLITPSNTSAYCCGYLSPAEAFAEAEVVFIGKIIRISPIKQKQRITTFQVEEPFYNVTSNEVTIHEYVSPIAPPDIELKLNGRYLVFAGLDKTTNKLRIYSCSHTAYLEFAEKDLAYLRGLTEDDLKGTIRGRVTRITALETELVSEPVADAKVIYQLGEQQYIATTDAQGNYLLPGVPPGKYQVRTEPALDYAEANKYSEVKVYTHGNNHAFTIAPQGEISGRITDEAGNGLSNIRLCLTPFNQQGSKQVRDFHRNAETDEFGNFQFTHLPVGPYLIGLGISSWCTGGDEIEALYFPGIKNRDSASQIRLDAAEKRTGINLILTQQQYKLYVTKDGW